MEGNPACANIPLYYMLFLADSFSHEEEGKGKLP
jgi:hypothetical protein